MNGNDPGGSAIFFSDPNGSGTPIGPYNWPPKPSGQPVGAFAGSSWPIYTPASYQISAFPYGGPSGCQDDFRINVTVPCSDTVPATPVVNSPADGATISGNTVNLTWQAFNSFGTKCSGNNNRLILNIDGDTFNVTGTTSYTFTYTGTPKKHTWFLQADNGALNSTSSPRTFDMVPVTKILSGTIKNVDGTPALNAGTLTGTPVCGAPPNYQTPSVADGTWSINYTVGQCYNIIFRPNSSWRVTSANPITSPLCPPLNASVDEVAQNSSAVWGDGVVVPNPLPAGGCSGVTIYVTPTVTTNAWWQASGGDVLAMGNISSVVPNNKFLIDGTAGVAGAAGGSVNTKDQSGVGGTVSSTNWQATGEMALSRKLLDRYGFEAMKQRIMSQVSIDPSNTNNISDLTGFKQDGNDYYFYKETGDLTISSLVGPIGTKRAIVIANGNVTINGPITFDDGGLFAVFAGGNINIDGSVGDTAPNASLQGIYFAKGTVFTGTGPKQLQINGTVVGLGGVSLERNVANANPLEVFNYQPKMMLNLPKTLLKQNNVWQEVAP